MAPTHLTDGDIGRFRSRRLPANALVAFGDHLAACGECRKRVAARSDAAAASAALLDGLGIGKDDHIAEAEVQAFIDGDLDTARRAEISTHLAECAACVEEVRDLSEFTTAFRRSARPGSPWMYGTFAAAAVLVLAIGATLFWRAQNASPAATLARIEGADALEPADAARVRDALASGRLSLPSALSDLTSRQGTLMGPARAPAFRLISPITTVVLDTRPTLRWSAFPNGATYIVTLQEQSTGATISSPPMEPTEWAPPQPLARGRVYAWQVAASAGGKEAVTPRPPDPPARFIVADASTAGRLEHLPSSPLVRGVLYADAGLLDDAEREFRSIEANGQGADRVAAFLVEIRQARAALTR